jgi:O-antigen/teichoic acid export membrane protein
MSLKKNTIWNLIGSGAPLVAALAFIPYTLARLGEEGFGVLTLIWALIGYFSLFDFGAGRAMTYEISRLQNHENGQELAKVQMILKSGLALTTATGLLGCLLIWFLAPHLAQDWLKISSHWQADSQLALQITALGIIPATITSGLRGAMEGMGNFMPSNVNKLLLGFSMFTTPAISIALHGPSLWQITLYLVLIRVFIVFFGFIQLRHCLQIKNYIVSTSKTTVTSLQRQMRELMSYGVWVSVTGIISPLMMYGDRFFISALVGADKLSVYAIPQEGLIRLLIVPAAICGALMPLFSSILCRQELITTYKENYQRMFKIMGILCGMAALAIYPVLSIWISPEFASKAYPIALIFIVGAFINGIATVSYTFLHAVGKTKLTAQFHIGELLIYLVMIYVLTNQFGLVGAAIAWVLRVTIDLILLNLAINRFKQTQHNLIAQANTNID